MSGVHAEKSQRARIQERTARIDWSEIDSDLDMAGYATIPGYSMRRWPHH